MKIDWIPLRLNRLRRSLRIQRGVLKPGVSARDLWLVGYSMFSFRRLRPPLTTFQRVDIELLMRRSIDMIGADRVRQTEIVTDFNQLPIDRSSPERLLSSASSVLKDHLPLMHADVELLIRDEVDLGYPAVYESGGAGKTPRILISKELLSDPLRTFMELAYQYASEFWHQVENPAPLDTDPRTTNLLPICCGLGIMASDSSLCDQQWSQAGYAGWSITRSGYYTAAEIGYAMALLARHRRDDNPSWLGRLRLDSRETAKNALRYFDEQQRRERLLLFDAERIPSTNSDPQQLARWLAGDDHAFALAAAYALCKHHEISAQAVDSAIQASRSGDRDLVPVAARLIGRGRADTAQARKRINELLSDQHPPTALAAVLSAHFCGIQLSRYRTRISKLLDQFAENPIELLAVIGQQGSHFASLEPQICEHLSRALRNSDDKLAQALIECLRCIAKEPRQAIERQIRSTEIREDALRRFDAAT